MATAAKNGWNLRNSGVIVVNKRRIRNDEVRYNEEQAERINQITKQIFTSFESTPQEELTKKWLIGIIDKNNHPEKYLPKKEEKVSFYELVELYIKKLRMVKSSRSLSYVKIS